MANKLMSVTVQGKSGAYSFNFYGDTKYLQEWRDDGLVIDVIVNTIPAWVVDIGLMRQWIFLQDLFNFKNPFRR